MNKLLKPFLALANSVVRRVLKSRFHWLLSHSVVMLEITGRNSGKLYLVPVNYRTTPGGISVMTYRWRNWWRNLQGVPGIPVYLKGERVIMCPERVSDDLEAIEQGLLDRGWARRATVRARAQDSLLIRLRRRDAAAEDDLEG